MSTRGDLPDERLGELLKDAGCRIEAQAPSFESVWRSARQTRAMRTEAPPHRWRWALATAAAVALAIVLLADRAPVSNPPAAPRLAEQAIEPEQDQALPTDFLLTTHARDTAIERLSAEISALLQP